VGRIIVDVRHLALVLQRVVGNLPKRLRQGYINCLIHCRRRFNSPTLVKEQRAFIFKVGVAPMYQAFKIRVGCGYRGIILA